MAAASSLRSKDALAACPKRLGIPRSLHVVGRQNSFFSTTED